MRVASNTFNNSLLTEITKLQSQQLRLNTQLAAQSKLINPSDNPVTHSEVSLIESRERAMQSYRQNLTRAEMVTDISKNHVGMLEDIVLEAIDAATMLNASLDDTDVMQGYANLINTLIKQAIDSMNTQNGDEYLFSGMSVKQEPFQITSDNSGDATIALGQIKQDAGDAIPTLITGNYYRIENNTGVDFTVGGAANNEVGTVFKYDGDAISWVPGSGASLTAVTGVIDESTKSQLEVGKAYEIVTRGTSTDMKLSGATSNDVGTQFIYNGTEPTTWNGAELVELMVDYDRPITQTDYIPYEFYKVTSGTATAFDSNAVNTILTNTFQYNGTAISDTTASATLLSRSVSEANQELLVSGTTYAITNLTGTFTGGGATTGAQVGDVFTYDGTSISSWGGAELIPVGTDDTNILNATTDPTGAKLVTGEWYKINSTGSDNFANLSSPPNAGTVGTVFQYNGVTPTYGTGQLLPLHQQKSSTDLLISDIGKAFVVVGGNNTLTGGGAGVNAAPGQRFVYDGTTFSPTDLGGAKLLELDEDPAQDLQLDHLYRIGKLRAGGETVPNLTDGDSLVAGVTYRVESIGTTTDLSNVGTAATTQTPTAIGDVFVASGTQPTEWGDAELKPLVLQDTEAFTGAELEIGRSYQIAATSSSTTIDFDLGDTDSLIVGETYTISNNGSRADFSAIGGSAAPDVGDTFTVNLGTTTSADVTFDDAVLVVPGDGTPITSYDDLVDGQTYQVVDNGSTFDMTQSGATNNSVGTSFVYNGTQPAWGGDSGGTIQYAVAATDFTTAGAPNNNVGTLWTATATTADFGNAGSLYYYRSLTTDGSDFTDIGATRNTVGEVFTYNGGTPVFDNENGDGGVLYAYKRKVLSAEYKGSTTDAPQFFIAENVKTTPFNEASDNTNFSDIINNLIYLRDGFQKAANATEDDEVTLLAARDMIKVAANDLEDDKENVRLSLANLDMNTLIFEFARRKDDNLYKNLEDIESQRTDINGAEIISQINQSFTALESALQSGARMSSLSIMDFL